MNVPFVDLERLHAPIAAKLDAAIAGVARRGDFILGAAVERFEGEFAAYVGAGEGIGVGSGTAALTLATRALGVGPGDEVIVPAHTFVASALGPLHAGATPVFCDVDPDSGLIDVDSAATLIGQRTAAIVAVHLYGQACDMDAIGELASRHGLAVIEDAAHAHGAAWHGRRCGSLGDVACFSFYPSKNLGAFGDGGIVTTSDPTLAERVRGLRHLGQLRKGEHTLAGYNERLDTIQAAVLAVKLPRLDAANDSRRAAAARYAERLPAGVGRLTSREGSDDVHHLYPIRIADPAAVAAALGERGIGTGLHYTPAVHHQPPFLADGHEAPSLPTAEAWAAEELSLPMFAGIRENEVDAVCAALAEVGEPALAPAGGGA